ncbi:Molecular chaperone Prefoldin, subunit 5 [Handroanthus impetiginosus]|uniref:Molecular chaperone Prefoldin, subunit 5 n=1 Tax=Handroanthus impetiginosus TaxID=429701 RepID=A0A2G9G2V6_9LAMI|nr:Molecular chaperone Prefoldin, subunit 5 [Handroanthus impetiginosus]
MEKKGTVTPLSSVFPAEEAQKASKRVEDTIGERQQQLDQLKGFIDDNIGLINLVQKLPDETHHNIMVPFGKAAFFPGRLIHTNEFMVLLGEGYYAERTAKQTVEILKRRGKTLETQVETVKAIMQDLRAEASFFDATASESAEGLVEIREDYVEEGSSETSAAAGHRESDTTRSRKKDGRKPAVEEDEYASIFSRIAELEKEEEEAEKEEEEEEEAETEEEEEEAKTEEEEEAGKANESDEDEQMQDELNSSISKISINEEVTTSQVEASQLAVLSKDGSSRRNYPTPDNSMMNKASELPEERKRVQDPVMTTNTAFTGSIVEHTHNIGMNLLEQQTGAPSSKPVSRFKLQRKQS